MPKSIFNIKSFHKGIETTPSEEDIAQDTASHSLNVDPLSQDGKLASIPHDRYLRTTGFYNLTIL